MPFQAMSSEEMSSAFRAADPDLQFILEDSGVSELGRARLCTATRTLSTFKNLADDRAGWRRMLAEDFGLGPEDGLAGKTEVAAILAAWEAAETWKTTKDRNDAEDRALGRARTLKASDYTRTKLSYEEIYGGLDDEFAPAKTLVEGIQNQLEEGEFRPEALSEIPSILECDGEPELQPTVAKDGTVKFKRTAKVTVAVPATPEQFRRRMRLLGNAFLFVHLRHPTHATLKTVDRDMWTYYCDYMLGPKVAGVEIKDPTGKVVAAPSWALVCAYDQQVRKRMCQNMNVKGMDVKAALLGAYRDQELKEEAFKSPLAVSVRVSPPTFPGHPGVVRGKGPGPQPKGGKAAGKKPKGVKKDSGATKKGKGKGNLYKIHGLTFKSVTADGMPICYRFNNPGEDCPGSCGKAHVCQVCDAADNAHPFHACPVYQKALSRGYQ